MKKFLWLMLLVACFVTSTVHAADEEGETILISVHLVLDDPKVEVLIETAEGKLEKLSTEKANAALKKNEHRVTDVIVKDSKLVKVVFKRKSNAAPKKPE